MLESSCQPTRFKSPNEFMTNEIGFKNHVCESVIIVVSETMNPSGFSLPETLPFQIAISQLRYNRRSVTSRQVAPVLTIQNIASINSRGSRGGLPSRKVLEKYPQTTPIPRPSFRVRHSVANSGCMENSICLLYTSPSPRDRQKSRMPSSA